MVRKFSRSDFSSSFSSLHDMKIQIPGYNCLHLAIFTVSESFKMFEKPPGRLIVKAALQFSLLTVGNTATMGQIHRYKGIFRSWPHQIGAGVYRCSCIQILFHPQVEMHMLVFKRSFSFLKTNMYLSQIKDL